MDQSTSLRSSEVGIGPAKQAQKLGVLRMNDKNVTVRYMEGDTVKEIGGFQESIGPFLTVRLPSGKYTSITTALVISITESAVQIPEIGLKVDLN
jgi:hypothetical protein